MATMELLDKEGSSEKGQARNSEKEGSQGWACLPWHVLLPFGNANTTLMNTSATREFSQHLFPFDQELFWSYFKRTYFENCFYGNMVSGSSKSFLIHMTWDFIHGQTFSNGIFQWFDQIKFRTPLFKIFLFLRFYLFIFRERGREGEREKEKHQCVAASHTSPTRDLGPNPGMCPDRELNQRPFGLQASTQSTEPHQPGHV